MAAIPAATIVLLFFSFTVLRSAHCADTRDNDDKVISNMKRVKDKIFTNYDKDVRPESHHNHTTHLNFDLVPLYVVELDEEKSLFTLDSWFVFFWHDKRLQWNRSDYDGIDLLSVPNSYVWQPDIRVYNGHSSSVDPMHDTHLIVFSDGHVIWVPPATVTSFCDVTTTVGSYPYDTHECKITVGCWTHGGLEINVNISSEEMYWDDFSNTNPRWEVVIENSKLSQVVRKHNCCEEIYITVDATFFLKRRPPTEMRVVGSSSVLVMILTLSMFWIPSNSGKKIILGGSLLIILTVLTIYCAAMTASPRAPFLSVSLVQSRMIAVASALALEILIINMGRMSGPRRPPDFLLRLLSGSVGDYMCICSPWSQSSPGNKIPLEEDAGLGSMEPTPQQEWLAVATSFDRMLFIIYIVVFAAIH